MDRQCYKQLRDSRKARMQLWFEISSSVASHNDWRTIDEASREIVEKILRDVIVEEWNFNDFSDD
jgi:hypothetical protein